jgi:hypothetical protein
MDAEIEDLLKWFRENLGGEHEDRFHRQIRVWRQPELTGEEKKKKKKPSPDPRSRVDANVPRRTTVAAVLQPPTQPIH